METLDFSALLVPFLVISLLALVQLIAMWKIYSKASQPGWGVLIPIYNLYLLLKITGKPGWWLLLFLIPGVNLIFIIWTYNMLSKSFGKDTGFTIGILLLGWIFIPILGFGSAKYQGPFGDPAKFASFQDKNKFDFENK